MFCLCSSHLGSKWSWVDVVIDLWNEEELDEHLTNIVYKEEWPDEPEVPDTPEVHGVSVNEKPNESNNVSKEWSEDGDWNDSLVKLTGELSVEESDGSPADADWPVGDLHGKNDLVVGGNNSVSVSEDKVEEEGGEGHQDGGDSVPHNGLHAVQLSGWHVFNLWISDALVSKDLVRLWHLF